MVLIINASKKILMISNKKMIMVLMERRRESVFISVSMDSAKKSYCLEMTNGFVTSARNIEIFTRLLSFSKYLRF